MRKLYAFSIWVKGKKKIGGCRHAESLEELFQGVCNSTGVKKVRDKSWEGYQLLYKGEKCSVCLWGHALDLKQDDTRG